LTVHLTDLLTILTPSTDRVNVRKYPGRGEMPRSLIMVVLETLVCTYE
jgi:hypothetical protein